MVTFRKKSAVPLIRHRIATSRSNEMARQNNLNASGLAVGLGCLVFIIVLLGNDYKYIGVPSILRDRDRVFGFLPYNLLVVTPLISAALVLDEQFRKVVTSRVSLLLTGILALWIAWGLARGATVQFISIDVRTVVWFWAGVAFLRLADLSGYLRGVLLFFVTSAIVFGYFVLLKSAPEGSVGTQRLYDTLYFDYDAMLMGLCGVWYMRYSLASLGGFVCGNALVLFTLYVGIVLAATRSIGLHILIFQGFAALSAFRLSQLSPRRFRPWLAKGMAIAFLVVIIGSVSVVTGFLFDTRSVFTERLLGSEVIISDERRMYEVENNFSSFRGIDLLLGRGVGASVAATDGNYLSPAFHFGLATFIYKFGALVGVTIAVILVLYIPGHYVQSLFSKIGPNRVSNLIHGPVFFSWLSLLLVSGGLSLYTMFGMGVCFGSWLSLKKEINN